MKENGIECSIVHERNDLLPIFRPYKQGELKFLDKINQDRVCIPLHHRLSDDDVGYVIDCIKKGW
jgi:dTDP-4-amino-4,6-dideoxygalactose transaminase